MAILICTRYRIDKGSVIHPVGEIYILPRKFDNSQAFNHVGADIIRPPTGYAEHRRGWSRLSARSVLLPAAEVSTGDPHPSASRFHFHPLPRGKGDIPHPVSDQYVWSVFFKDMRSIHNQQFWVASLRLYLFEIDIYDKRIMF